MKCPDNGVIQAYIDGELGINIKKEFENHLAECRNCSETLDELKSNDDFVFTRINDYKEYMNEKTIIKAEPFSSQTNNNLEVQDTNNTKKGVYKIMTKYKKYAIAACAALVVTTCLAYQPVRASIFNSLSIFRADNVKGFKITPEDLMSINEKLSKNEAEIDMDQMGKVKNTRGEHKEINISEAKSLSDLKVVFPTETYGTDPEIFTNGKSTTEFTLNVEYINKVLESFGAKTLLPKEVDGKTFQVNIPRQVILNYNLENQKNFSILQTKTPEINAPEGVNPDDLYNALIDMPIIPENMNKQLKSIKDWKNTLYIPVVDSGMEEIIINSVKGYTFTSKNNDDSQFSNIIWFKNDVIYSISGNMSVDELTTIGNSMR